MSSPTRQSDAWQNALGEHCKTHGLSPPVWNILSDRRGGRTAWSSTVIVDGELVQAKAWYDGHYVNNAKEDAAEQALQFLKSRPFLGPAHGRPRTEAPMLANSTFERKTMPNQNQTAQSSSDHATSISIDEQFNDELQ